jgi:CheY-like chemotaxis protein
MASVLIVEDEAQVLMLAESYLHEHGHQTLSASTVTGATALLNGDAVARCSFWQSAKLISWTEKCRRRAPQPRVLPRAPALKAGKAAAERAPAAEVITNARRFMDVTFSLDMFASFKISGHEAKRLRL